MPVYIYETTGKTKRRFEIRQSMKDEPLKTDPETGEPVRRVITGGYGIMEKGKPSARRPAISRAGHSCGSGCGCC